MTTKLLAVLVATATTAAWAEPQTSVDQREAIAMKQERDAAVRVDYYAMETIIAERDAATAQIIVDMAVKQREVALSRNDAKAVRAWEKRHRGALADQREAQDRAARFRAERDRAREAFEASAADLRRLHRRG